MGLPSFSPGRRMVQVDWHNEIREALPADPVTASAHQAIQAGSSDWVEEEGLLWHKHRLFVPQLPHVRRRILQEAHDSPSAGHQGIHRTIAAVQQSFYWPHLAQDVRELCDACQHNKASRQQPAGLLQPLPIPLMPWDQEGTQSTTRPWATSQRISTEEQLMKVLRAVHKIPKRMRARSLHLFSLIKATLQPSFSTFHPQSDGATERANQVLEDMLRAYAGLQQDHWATHLHFAEFAYNNASNSSTSVSPFLFNKGFHPGLACQLLYQLTPLFRLQQISWDVELPFRSKPAAWPMRPRTGRLSMPTGIVVLSLLMLAAMFYFLLGICPLQRVCTSCLLGTLVRTKSLSSTSSYPH